MTLVKFNLSLSIQAPLPLQNWTMTPTTKNYCYFWHFPYLATLPQRLRHSDWHCNWPQKLGILLYNQCPYLPTSLLVQIPLSIYLLVHFHPGCIGTKPDSLTCCWDVYSKEGNSDYASVNPNNCQPAFSDDQLQHSLWATELITPTLHADMLAVVWEVQCTKTKIIKLLLGAIGVLLQ